MQPVADIAMILGFIIGGWEVLLMIAVGITIFAAKGFFEFRDAVIDELNDDANQAGRSLGGIYGAPAAEALTTDNQVAEFYPTKTQNEKESRRKRPFKTLLRKLWQVVRR